MPDIGALHPPIVHFVIGLLVIGVVFRLVSLTGKLKFTGPSASVLLIAGGIAAWLAVRSGTDAHDRAERIPGVRQAVVEHEDWGKRTKNVFLVVAGLEIVGLALTRKPWAKWILVGSAVVGAGGLAALYETGEHGGELVYAYAGGVGTRHNDTADVERLLVAGLYQQAMVDRRAGRHERAAALIDELAIRRPGDPEVELMAIESKLVDRADAQGALDALDAMEVRPDDRRTAYRVESLRADAYEKLGVVDSARAALQRVLKLFPDNRRIQAHLDSLK